MTVRKIRRAAEFISREISFKRRLPDRFGALRLYVSPGASLCYYKSFAAPNWNDLFDFAETYIQPGTCIWDVGANMGVLTFAAASRAGATGRVLALEADSWSIGHLRCSKLLNKEEPVNVDILQVAISNSLSVETLNIPQRNRAATHLAMAGGAGAELIGGVREQQLVVSITLDWLAQHYEAPSVLKIDVDGGEMRVLQGATNLISELRPTILTEVYERNADAVTQFFHNLEYKLFDFNYGTKGKVEIQRAVYNTLALPRV